MHASHFKTSFRQQLPTTLLFNVNYHTFKGRAGYSDTSACSSVRAFKELIELPEGWSLPPQASFEEDTILIGLRAGLPVMKRILLVFILAAAVMYGILHGNLWRNNLYWLPPTAVERRNALDTCLLKPAFESLLGVDKIYPFLCANDFIRVAEFHGSDKFELPYGIKRAEQFFRLALSRLQNCGLSNEDDSIACRRCVVVGNGGVLRNKTLGEKIDSYDVIIRMNNGPVIGYEEDVGRRTTFRLSYPESIFSDPIHYDPNTTVVLIVFKPRDLKWLWEILGGQKIKPKHPTTGLIAITLAFHICHEVHLAGFKYDFTDRNSSLHYYGNDTMSQMMQNEYHNINAEQKFLKKLIDKNFVVNLT
ncbi:type 2 lactosamine alpha-2,3-sialyltransferase isoform 4-T4 [Pluvialis apricaria]